jgi:hypothetical protein
MKIKAPDFPVEQLRQDFGLRQLTPRTAAAPAEVDYKTISAWLIGRWPPKYDRLIRVLDANGIPRDRYAPYLDAVNPVVILSCPSCSHRRPLPRGRLKRAARAVKGRRVLPRLPDGSYALRCAECFRRANGRQVFKRVHRRQLTRRLGQKEADRVIDGAEQGDPTSVEERRRAIMLGLGGDEARARRQEQFCKFVKQPKTEKHRRGMALSHLVLNARRLTKSFALCPLCELVIYEARWHGPCYLAWQTWHRRTHKRGPGTALPLAVRHHGPRPDPNIIRRNYWWLLAHRGGLRSRRTLLADAKLGARATKPTVNLGVASFVKLLPGDWRLVFSKDDHGRINRTRNFYVPLPDELEPLVERGERGAVIWRLLGFGMADTAIARVTGASCNGCEA